MLRLHPLISIQLCAVVVIFTWTRSATLDAQDVSFVARLKPLTLFDMSQVFPKPQKINDSIYQATGISNTTMVVTDEGNVIIDTSLPQLAGLHKKTLQRENDNAIRYIILTHAHQDHTGGLSVWKEPSTEIIAQENSVEFLQYQGRLASFFSRRNAAQFAVSLPMELPQGNYGAEIQATVLFRDSYEFKLGGLDFQLHHTPGETYDHLSVWIPQLKAAFVGDNYYRSFPNLYTPRGTKPRYALDYVNSLNKVLSWNPELLISGHSPTIVGREEIQKTLTKFRDAILYVHDATVQGMNDGKPVDQLMREIKLPDELEQDEKYGSVAWSVRGIYEGYAGWFDGNPASMYGEPVSSSYPDLVAMAGGPTTVAKNAIALIDEGSLMKGLHMADVALACDAENRVALQARLKALELLAEKSGNSIESGWLLHGIRDAKSRLAHLSEVRIPRVISASHETVTKPIVLEGG